MRQEGEPSVEEILESIKKVIARDNRAFANFNNIRVVDGTPDPDDLHRAWANGARVFRLRLR